MARNSFAGRVLATIKKEYGLSGGEFGVDELIAPLFLQTRKDKKRCLNALRDHVEAGRLVRAARGRYRLPYADERHRKKPPIHKRMWNIMRWKGTVTIADLQELTGTSESYAREWLRMLIRREIVRRLPQPGNQPCKYQLIKRDQVTPPVNDEKADYLKKLRKNQQASLESVGKSLLQAGHHVMDAARTLKKMEAFDDQQ